MWEFVFGCLAVFCAVLGWFLPVGGLLLATGVIIVTLVFLILRAVKSSPYGGSTPGLGGAATLLAVILVGGILVVPMWIIALVRYFFS